MAFVSAIQVAIRMHTFRHRGTLYPQSKLRQYIYLQCSIDIYFSYSSHMFVMNLFSLVMWTMYCLNIMSSLALSNSKGNIYDNTFCIKLYVNRTASMIHGCLRNTKVYLEFVLYFFLKWNALKLRISLRYNCTKSIECHIDNRYSRGHAILCKTVYSLKPLNSYIASCTLKQHCWLWLLILVMRVNVISDLMNTLVA